MRLLSFLCFLLMLACGHSTEVWAQNRANIWYFGYKAGVDFSSGSPVALGNSSLHAFEGCASICNERGELLFYTNGIVVYDRLHYSMPNGSDLNGDMSTTQSGVIVPAPMDTNRYYVFSLDKQGGPNGLQYSVVDMRLNDGRGDVVDTMKNIPLRTKLAEKISGAVHADRRSYWIVTHGHGNNSFYAYRVTRTGVDPVPVTTSIGSVHDNTVYGALGYMKISPDGKRLACAVTGQPFIEVFDFDNATGKLSNTLHLKVPLGVYGIEFSPNGKLLYYAMEMKWGITQLNLDLGDAASIVNNSYYIDDDSYPQGGALQLGPDQKLYANNFSSSSLGVINQPDKVGAACDYGSKAVKLVNECLFGLPNFLPGLLLPRPRIVVQNYCLGDSTRFSAVWDFVKKKTDSVYWIYDDGTPPADGGKFNTNHLYKSVGLYTVQFVYIVEGVPDTVEKTIGIYDPPRDFFPADTTVCFGDEITLEGPPGADQYFWWDGSTDRRKTVQLPWNYKLTAWYGHCAIKDSVTLKNYPPVSVELGPADTFMCGVDEYMITADTAAGYTYRWHNGSTARTYRTGRSEKIWLEISNGHCTYSDTQNAVLLRPPWFSFGNDTNICSGESFLLEVNNDYSTVQWHDGSSKKSMKVKGAGTYSVVVSNRCGEFEETIHVYEYPPLRLDIGRDTILCEGDELRLDAGDSMGYTFRWNDGSAGTKLWAGSGGRYYVTKTGPCGSITDSIEIEGLLCDCPIHIPNTFTPNRDLLNEKWRPQLCPVHDYYLEIYNRWGQCIYTSTDPDEGWDGMYKGRLVQEGLYIYQLKATNHLYQKIYRNGKIYVVR